MTGQELTRRDPWALQPETREEAWESSTTLAGALLDIVPANLRRRPADIFAVILYGQEVGLTQMQALNSVYLVNGKASLSGEAMLALVLQAGHQVRFKKVTAKECVVAGRRVDERDDPEAWQEFSFTLAEAELAGLTRPRGRDAKPGPWQLYPADMLRWRALSRLCKVVFPDAIRGMASAELMRDAVDLEGTTSPAPAPVVVVEPPKVTTARRQPKAPDTVSQPVSARPPGRSARSERSSDPIPESESEAEVVEVVEAEVIEVKPPGGTRPATQAQIKKIHTVLKKLGVHDARHGFLTDMVGRRIESTKDLSKTEAQYVIDQLEAPPVGDPPPTNEPPPEPGESPGLASEEQRIAIGALLEAHQMARAELALPFYSDVVGRPVASTKTLTVVEADAVLAALRATLPPGTETQS